MKMKTRLLVISLITVLIVCGIVGVAGWKTAWFGLAAPENEMVEKKEPVTEPETNNPLLLAKFDTESLLTGDGTIPVMRGYIKTTKRQLKLTTQEQFAEFVLRRVRNSGYNWVTLICEDGTGVVFTGNDIERPAYGDLDEIGRITKLKAQLYTRGEEEQSGVDQKLS